MSANYDDPVYAGIFFNLWCKVPVYHAFDYDRMNENGCQMTRCGRVESSYVDGRYRAPGTAIPIQHARKFGRPCGHCFPPGYEDAA